MHVLSQAGLLKGVILYHREETTLCPFFILERREGVLCAIVTFNFRMTVVTVQNILAAAATELGDQKGDPCMLYYQTDTLLSYHPTWLPCCVTHHGPFYNDLTQYFSCQSVAIAFGGDEKAQHLQRQQELGICYVKSSSNAFVLQHSRLQRAYLLRSGIDQARIRKLSPPIQLMSESLIPVFNKTSLINFPDPDGLLLFTTVARLDFFKNVELLLDSGLELLGRGLAINVFVAGDDERHDERRYALLRRIPPRFCHRFRIMPKLTKTDLYALFIAVRARAIFVCPSRYETLGITPLEAALSGVTTIISDAKEVEASQYFPAENRFPPNAQELADLVEGFISRDVGGYGDRLARQIKNVLCERDFELDLLRAWSDFSSSVNLVATV